MSWTIRERRSAVLFVSKNEIFRSAHGGDDECEESPKSHFLQSVGVETIVHVHTALVSASALTSHSAAAAADVIVTYMLPDAQREIQDVVSAGRPQQLWLLSDSDSVSGGV